MNSDSGLCSRTHHNEAFTETNVKSRINNRNHAIDHSNSPMNLITIMWTVQLNLQRDYNKRKLESSSTITTNKKPSRNSLSTRSRKATRCILQSPHQVPSIMKIGSIYNLNDRGGRQLSKTEKQKKNKIINK